MASKIISIVLCNPPLLTEWPLGDKESDHNVDADDTGGDGIDEGDGLKL